MTSSLLFAISTPLSSASYTKRTKKEVRCTLAPDLPAGAESKRMSSTSSKSKYFRPLPADLSHSERPPPTPMHRSVPVVGFFIDQLRGLDWRGRLNRLHGDICTSPYFLKPTVYVSHYDAIVDILRNTDLFQSKDAFDAFSRFFGKDSIITLDPPAHGAARGTVASAFSSSLFPLYFPCILAHTQMLWQRILNDRRKGNEVLLDPRFRDHYLSIIVEISTGLHADSCTSAAVRKHFGNIQDAFFLPAFGPVWNRAQKAKQAIFEILRGIIATNLAKKSHVIEKLRQYGDKLPYLGSKDIKNGEVDVMLVVMAISNISTEPGVQPDPHIVTSVCNMMLMLWFAGYSTSAAASSSAVFELGWDSSLVMQLRAEQDELIASADGDRDMTYNQVNKNMPLLDSYITEILRMYPPATGSYRIVSKDVEIMGYYVKKGLPLFVDHASTMRDDRFFPNGDTLQIDRFVKREGTRPANRILSFGGPGSPHYCLGSALSKIFMKSTIALLLREYDFSLDPEQNRGFRVIPDQCPISKVVLGDLAYRPAHGSK